MSQVKDPVCGRTVDSDEAAWTATYESRGYFFCSDKCRLTFVANPEDFVRAERHEPPYTESHGFIAPKFGSAGSGGLEHEPVPEMHDEE
jgi:YHS domain-containing protein